MRKLLLFPFLILSVFCLSGCSDRTPLEPEANTLEPQAKSASRPIKEYWFADYMPLVPGLYGTKTYQDGPDQFTSRIVGTETVPYSTGPINGVTISFEDDSFVWYSHKRHFWWLKDGDAVLSTTCHELTAYPPSAVIGKVHDGMILDMTGGETIWEVNANDYDDCEEVNTGEGDSHVWLIQIQDVHMPGKTYKNAILIWELEPNSDYSFSPIDFDGAEEILGIRLPTAAEANNWAIDDVVMLGHRVGIFLQGDVGLDTGVLDVDAYLVSVSHKPAP